MLLACARNTAHRTRFQSRCSGIWHKAKAASARRAGCTTGRGRGPPPAAAGLLRRRRPAPPTAIGHARAAGPLWRTWGAGERGWRCSRCCSLLSCCRTPRGWVGVALLVFLSPAGDRRGGCSRSAVTGSPLAVASPNRGCERCKMARGAALRNWRGGSRGWLPCPRRGRHHSPACRRGLTILICAQPWPCQHVCCHSSPAHQLGRERSRSLRPHPTPALPAFFGRPLFSFACTVSSTLQSQNKSKAGKKGCIPCS